MTKKREFDNILDECLERVFRGESIEACLKSYPQYATELELLLRTAFDAREATAVMPRPEFRELAGVKFQTAVRELAPQQRRGGLLGWYPRWAVAVTVVIIVLMAGSGTVAAASNSLPDSPLYPVKLVTEDVRIALASSDIGKAGLYAEFANKRVDEIVRMADKGKLEKIERATERMSDQLTAVADLVGPAVETEAMSIMAAPPPEAAGAGPTAIGPLVVPPSTTSPPEVSDNAVGIVPPAPVVAVPTATVPPQETVGSEAPVSGEEGAKKRTTTIEKNGKRDEHSELRDRLSRQAAENERELKKLLERSPGSLKPSLEKSLEAARRGYERALSGLED